MTYYPAIDGLRAVAVLSVVLYHAGFTALFGGGYIGVDIFFVISGYLISTIIYNQLQNKSFSLVDFYTRRLRRIMPALFVCLALTTVTATQILIQEFKSFCDALISAVLMAANIWFCFNSGYFAAPAKNIPLLHTWSLGVEEQFYLVFPLLMMLLVRKPRTLLLLLGVCFFASFLGSIYNVYTNASFAFYSLHTRAWELLAGSLLAVHGPFSLTTRQCRLCIYAGLCMISAAIVGYGYTYVDFPGFAALPPVAGAILCIIGAISCREVAPFTLLHSRPAIFIGLISYSLYLWHWPVLVLYRHATESFAGLSARVALSLIALIFVLAWLSWKYVENPVRSRRILAKPATLYSACGAFAIILFAVGWLGHVGYLEWRLPKQALAYAQQAKGRSALQHPVPGVSKDLSKNTFYFGMEGQEPTVLLLGDSHADALGEALDALAREYGVSGIMIWGQSPLLGAHNIHDFFDSRTYQNEIVSIIKRHPSLNRALLALRWPIYTEGGKPHESELFAQEIFSLRAEDNQGALVSTDPIKALEYGLHSTLTFLRDTGIDAWVLHCVPEQNTNIPRRAARLSMWSKDSLEEQLGVTLKEHRQRNAKITPLLHDVIPARARHIDPTDILCDDSGFCNAARNGVLLYYDDNHLSVEGSKLLLPALRQIFQ